jgi:hypothetical protein
MLLSGSDIFAGWDIGDDLLANPATVEDLGLRITKAPFEVWDRASICAFRTQIVGVLQVNLVVCSSCRCVSKKERLLMKETLA